MKNSNLKTLLVSAILIMQTLMHAQIIKKSVGNYSSELLKTEVKGKSYKTKISFYSGSNLLTIDDDLASIRYNDMKQDTLKQSKGKPIAFKFQSTMQGNFIQVFKENKYANLIRIEGNLTINNVTKECVAFYAPIILDQGSNEVLMDFVIKFDLNDFNIEEQLPVSGLVELEIEDGYVFKYN